MKTKLSLRRVICAAVLIVPLAWLMGCPTDRQAASTPHFGNPIFPGWYADPEGAVFGGRFWVYPTYSAPYIVYHRRLLGERDGNHRVTCIDRMGFDERGLIKPVKITFEGVPKVKL